MFRCLHATALAALVTGVMSGLPSGAADDELVRFNEDIRPILSNRCYRCHGPDDAQRQAGLRLDGREGAIAELDSGARAVTPGAPDASELVARINSSDDSLRMPPPESGPRLTPREAELFRKWVAQGAPYARHWSYEPPIRPPLPAVRQAEWPRNAIDQFLLARLEREGLKPADESDRHALIRRLSLDLTGLPPSLADVERFVSDRGPDAYERLVERLLDSPAFGEHWSRMWLDLARYADSAGYADDPPRTIWAFRDYVIRSLNQNKPFDQFTIEQLAGDLLEQPTEEQLIATAFHRNTLTNNEGGTNDEEFRNVAVVDRVNTTFAVWMGTTMACAQCHNHKYDPISQKEYFQFFAIFNSSQDADRRDEGPLVEVWTPQQQWRRERWEQERQALDDDFARITPERRAAMESWRQRIAPPLDWKPLHPTAARAQSGHAVETLEDGSLRVAEAADTDIYTLDIPWSAAASPTALRLESLPDPALPGGGAGHGGGNFVVTRVTAEFRHRDQRGAVAKRIRVSLPGKHKMLSLAEVQAFHGDKNVAPSGAASQSSTDFGGPANLAIDGNTDGDYQKKSTTHTKASDDPWWELDFGEPREIDRIVIWNRTDNQLQSRLDGVRIEALSAEGDVVWGQTLDKAPMREQALALSDTRPVKLTGATALYAQAGFAADGVLDAADKSGDQTGWAVGGRATEPHALLIAAAGPTPLEAALLRVTIEQKSQHKKHVLGRFRISATEDSRAAEVIQTAGPQLAAARQERLDDAARDALTRYYLDDVAPELAASRKRRAELTAQLAALKPETTVPVMRELPADKRRQTRLQHRGNYLDLGEEVAAGLPEAFHTFDAVASLSQRAGAPVDRLEVARWLVDDDNPLTPRVIANRYWEAIFGLGLVATSEEFGSQGERPTHPELLDWLATELVRSDWNVKRFLRLLVTSSAYRQSSRVTPELLRVDPDNALLSRGPRFRLSAEMVRDQALAAAGLLSHKLYGPPVKPLQPQLGVSAAFGSGIDWSPSDGEDRYRRGLYTTWRRSNPYPSMAAFDAPNREVCTVRRSRTNTPLQALVTLNDPVYVEAAQALARRMAAVDGDAAARVDAGFQMCLARRPRPAEQQLLGELYASSRRQFAEQAAAAKEMATDPLGPLPAGADAAELAAWTVVANVLLNLDEMFMKR